MRRLVLSVCLSFVATFGAACGPVDPEGHGNGNGNGNGNSPWDAAVPGDGTVSGCSEQSKYVYVVDDQNVMYRFDPRIANVSAFTAVGTMAGCSSGGAPNSMSVGRDGYAYVLYGETDPLFGDFVCKGVNRVSLDNAACLGATPFVCGAEGFSRFGMGFATDGAGAETDTLYLGDSEGTSLGTLDEVGGAVAIVGTLPDLGAEFTGNANGELWGFFPYQDPPAVMKIDKATGSSLQRIDLDSLTPIGLATEAAWAFAFWGGSFYIFYQVSPPDPSTNVYRLRSEGEFDLYIANTGMRIVGAGVSTCAPVVVL